MLDGREGELLGRGAAGVVGDSDRRIETSIPFPRKKIKAQLLSESVTSRHSTCGFYYHVLELCMSFSFINHRGQQA